LKSIDWILDLLDLIVNTNSGRNVSKFRV
jgi:hypothetical protein